MARFRFKRPRFRFRFRRPRRRVRRSTGSILNPRKKIMGVSVGNILLVICGFLAFKNWDKIKEKLGIK